MRTSCPSNNKNYITTSAGGWNTCIVGNPTKSGANALANCVGYSSGRFNEIINEARGTSICTYKTLNCNAENFIERAKNAGLSVGSTPKVGAIMCWQKGATLSSSDGAGHVCIVEQVYDNNHVYTSESGYNSSYFWNAHRYNTNGRWGIASGYTFRGFIYLPSDVQSKIDSTPTPTPSPSGKFSVGDSVVINGPLYVSSNATTSSSSVSNKSTKITRVVGGALHPYNTTGDLGWMDESSITASSDNSGGNTSSWPKSYTVKSGDTLSKIAESFYGNGDKAHYNFIASANGIADANKISAGQKLTIPEYTGSSSSNSSSSSTSLKAGDTVQITGYGNSNSNGTGNKAGGIGWTRKILKVYSGRKYPYQVGNDSGTTGFYQESSLKKM
jgi:surface antigen